MESKQVVSFCRTAGLQIRTNIAIPKSIRFYVPDDDDSVPFVFALSTHTIASAKGYEEPLLTGYFSGLCAVLPELTSVSKMTLKNLGLPAEDTMIPSQAARANIEVPQSTDLKLEAVKFAQMCFLPFQNSDDDNMVATFWNQVASAVGAKLSADNQIFSVIDMKTIDSVLILSGLKGELRTGIAASLKALLMTSTPVSYVVSEAGRINRLDSYLLYSNDVHT